MLEAVIGLPADLFYGTGIPACVLVLNKKDAANREHVLFINADREYREGKAQNFLRPEDIEKIVHVYRDRHERAPATPGRVPVSEIAAEDFNCNIRRYVDNAPPPEPHDVRAHLHGGVPVAEIDALDHFWKNYRRPARTRASCRAPRGPDAYADFAPAVTDRRALAELVKSDPGVADGPRALSRDARSLVASSTCRSSKRSRRSNGKKGNVYELRRQLLGSIATTFAEQHLLTDHQVRGAFARYVDDLQGRPQVHRRQRLGTGADSRRRHSAEPVPRGARRDGTEARCASPNWPRSSPPPMRRTTRTATTPACCPSDEVKALKAELKEANAQAKLAKKEKRDPSEFLAACRSG